jgi:hypothetical protein
MNDSQPMTDHTQAEAALGRFLDGLPNWDSAEAMAHRSNCADCRDDLDAARAMLHATSIRETPISYRSDAILSAVLRDTRQRRFYRWTIRATGAIGLATAASLAVVYLLPQRTEIDKPVANSSQKIDVAQPIPSMNPLVDPREALAKLAGKLADDVSPGPVELPKLPEVVAEDTWKPLRETGESASKSMQPLASTAKRALGAFLKTTSTINRNAQ